MYLKELKIKKFRGINDLSLDFEKGINVLSAKNGVGKTTVLDIVLWLFADETLVYGGDNTSNVDLNDPNAEVEVNGTFVKDDDSILELARKYKAVYKKDGSFSNYENTLFINGAEYKITEYKARINQEIGLVNDSQVKGFNTIRAIMDYDYLGSIDYKITREKIEKILNISSDDELLKGGKYKEIEQDLKAQLFDTSKCKTKFNKTIKDCEAIINQKEKEVEELKSHLIPFDKEKHDSLIEEKTSLETSFYKNSEEYTNFLEKQQETQKLINEKQKAYNQKELQYQRYVDLSNQFSKEVEIAKNELIKIKDLFELKKNSIVVCPNCNKPINDDKVKKELAMIKEKFDEKKKAYNSMEKPDTQEMENVKEELSQTKKELDEARNILNELQNNSTKMLESENAKMQEFNSNKTQRIIEINNQLLEMEKNADSKIIEGMEKDIEKYKNQKAKNELYLMLLEDFRKDKIAYIESKTESIFPGIKFVLFEESNTGAVKNVCKATYNNVDYLGLNVGRRILLGFEIVEDLKKALGITESLPIIFDKLHDLDNDNILKLKTITNSQVLTTRSGDTDKIEIKHI